MSNLQTAPILVLVAAATLTAAPAQGSVEQNRRANYGIELYSQGKIEEGLAELKAAIAMDPKVAVWHMDYGSFLFDQARANFYRSGLSRETLSWARRAKPELEKAVELFSKDESFPEAQCHYLLGDLYAYILEDVPKAKVEYGKALKLNPQHADAMAGMMRLVRGAAEEKLDAAMLEKAKKPSKPVFAIVKPRPPSIALRDKILLANGQEIDVNIVEQTKDGVWVEMDAGTRVFFNMSEIRSVNKSHES